MENKKTLTLYKNRKIILQRAAELLKIGLPEMLELVKKEGLHLDYSNEELKEDLKGFRKN